MDHEQRITQKAIDNSTQMVEQLLKQLETLQDQLEMCRPNSVRHKQILQVMKKAKAELDQHIESKTMAERLMLRQSTNQQ